jgi:hypothetical protein
MNNYENTPFVEGISDYTGLSPVAIQRLHGLIYSFEDLHELMWEYRTSNPVEAVDYVDIIDSLLSRDCFYFDTLNHIQNYLSSMQRVTELEAELNEEIQRNKKAANNESVENLYAMKRYLGLNKELIETQKECVSSMNYVQKSFSDIIEEIAKLKSHEWLNLWEEDEEGEDDVY